MRPRRRRPISRISRAGGIALSLAAIAVVWGLATWLTPPSAPLAGRASAVDGDTLRLGSARMRLTGLDAVELEQICTGPGGDEWACGREARDFLADRVRGAEVTCTPSGRDRYGRVLARCELRGADLGMAIVVAGWAVADLDYTAAELQARAEGAGIWAGQFDPPADWRRDHGDPGFNLWDWLRGWFG